MNKVAGATLTRPRSSPNAIRGRRLVAAFNEVRAELLSTLVYVLGNHEDAQDALQDAFLKCWRIRRKLCQVQNLRGWIFRVGLNAGKDLQRNAWRRRARSLTRAQDVQPTVEASPADLLADRETLDRLRAALINLRPEEKEVFLLRQNGCLTYEEIAELHHRPVGTVKTQMRSALQKLRECVKEAEHDGMKA